MEWSQDVSAVSPEALCDTKEWGETLERLTIIILNSVHRHSLSDIADLMIRGSVDVSQHERVYSVANMQLWSDIQFSEVQRPDFTQAISEL